jgi:hypothetical protein
MGVEDGRPDCVVTYQFWWDLFASVLLVQVWTTGLSPQAATGGYLLNIRPSRRTLLGELVDNCAGLQEPMAETSALPDRAAENQTSLSAPISFRKASSDVDRVLEVMQRQLQLLKQEHGAIQQSIVTVKRTIAGLACIFGQSVISEELRGALSARTMRPNGSGPGLTRTCAQLLAESPEPLTAAELLALIQQKYPSLLTHNKDPKASLTTVLGRLSKYGDVQGVLNEGGARAWQSTIQLGDAKKRDDRDSQQRPLGEELGRKR